MIDPVHQQNCREALEHLLYDVEEDPEEYKEGAAESLRSTLAIFKAPRQPSTVFLQ